MPPVLIASGTGPGAVLQAFPVSLAGRPSTLILSGSAPRGRISYQLGVGAAGTGIGGGGPGLPLGFTWASRANSDYLHSAVNFYAKIACWTGPVSPQASPIHCPFPDDKYPASFSLGVYLSNFDGWTDEIEFFVFADNFYEPGDPPPPASGCPPRTRPPWPYGGIGRIDATPGPAGSLRARHPLMGHGGISTR